MKRELKVLPSLLIESMVLHRKAHPDEKGTESSSSSALAATDSTRSQGPSR